MIRNYIHYLIWGMFVMMIMIDPTGRLLHLKEVSFISLILYFMFSRQLYMSKGLVTDFLKIIGIALLSVILGSIFYYSDPFESIAYFKSLGFILVFIAIGRYSIFEIIKINAICGLTLSIVIIAIFTCYMLGYVTYERLIETENVMIAERDFMGIPTFMFFYKSMPFVFFALVYYLRKNNYLASSVILFSILIGGSRTPILCAFLLLFYILVNKSNKYFKLIITLFSITFVMYVLNELLSSRNLNDGDDTKFRIAISLFNQSSILPHGAGVTYMDVARKLRTSSTEMTYFEMLYQYGWILFPFMFSLIIKPVVKLWRVKTIIIKDFLVAYIVYLVNAGTNPLLFSSTGMYIYSCALIIMSKRKMMCLTN